MCQHRQEASEDLRAVISHKHWQTGKRHAYQLLKPAELIRFLVTTEAGGVGRQACCENCGTNGVLAPGDEVSLQQYVAEYLTVDEFKRALHSLDFVVDESNQIFEYRPGEAPEDVVLL